MKTSIPLSKLAALAVAFSFTSVFAQSAPDSAPGMTIPPGGGQQLRQGPGHHGGGNLTPEERQILMEARKKALADPELAALEKQSQSLAQDLKMKMHQAMVKADPRVEELLKKAGPEMKGRRDEMREKFQNMSPEDRAKMKSALDKAKEDPAVKGAREKMKTAETPEAKKAAMTELREAMKAAISKIDPALVDKIPPMDGKREGKGKGQPGPKPGEAI